MKHIIPYVALILSWLCLPLIAADKKPKIVPNGPKAKEAIEKEIRFRLGKPPGMLTEPDLMKVKTLDLNQKKISDVGALKRLRQVKWLWLNSNKICDVSALRELRQLRYLDLGFNQVTDLSALKNLKLLTHLDLRNNPNLSNSQVAEIRAALPKCRIYSNPSK